MKNILVSGTSKNDIISNSGSKVTINADAGSDTIVFDYALRSVIQYTEDDGNDTLKIVGSFFHFNQKERQQRYRNGREKAR